MKLIITTTIEEVRAQVRDAEGPLTMKDAMVKGHYAWWKGPWPWQYPEEEA